MNKVYKVVWNASLGVFVAVSELATARGKSSSTTNNAASSADKKAGIFKPAKTALVLAMLFVLPHSVMAAENVDANNLTVAGTSTFTGAATFNGGITANSITANSITVGGKAVATSDQITNLEANKADKTAVDALSNRVTTLGLTDEYTGIKYFRVKSTADDAKANATDSVAIGPKALTEASATKGIAIGDSAKATGVEATAVGPSAQAGNFGLAAGSNARATGQASVALGQDALSNSQNTVAIGKGAAALAADAIAVGNSAQALEYSLAAGSKARADGVASIALGQNAQSTSENSVAIGKNAQAKPWRTISIGQDAGKNQVEDIIGDKNEHINIGVRAGENIDGQLNISIGQSAGSNTQGKGNIALGQNAGQHTGGTDSSVGNNIAIGTNANRFSSSTGVQEATAIGFEAMASGTRSVALGKQTKSTALDSVAIGTSSEAKGTNSVAIGLSAIVNGADNVALGAKSVADTKVGAGYLTGKPSNTVVSVGNDTLQRRIVNVADGADDQDAVTVAQLKRTSDDVFSKVNAAINNIPANSGSGINYDTTTRPGQANSITLKKDTVIGNVAPGVLDTDAVNVKQLNQTVEANKTHYFSTKVTGATQGNYNNDGAQGDISLAVGMDVLSTGDRSVTVGNKSTAESKGGIAIGALYEGSAALDDKVPQNAVQTVAKSSNGQPFEYNMAIGAGASSEGNNSIAIGSLAKTSTKQQQNLSPDRAIAIGYFAAASEVKANAIGDRATSSAEKANAFGSQAFSSGVSSTAIGTVAQASGQNSIAMGTHQRVTGANSGSIGYAGDYTPTNVGRDPSGTHADNATLVSGTGTYSVGNTNSTVTSNESGIFGNDNFIQAVENVRVVGNKNTVSKNNPPPGITKTLKDVYITGYNNQVDVAATPMANSKNLFIMGAANKIGTKDALTITDSYVIGTNNTINTPNTASDSDDPSNPGAKVGKGFFILGNNVTATKENSVYLGTDAAYTAKGASTDGDAAVTEPVTVGGTLTYGGFAGKTPVGVVTVGDVGKERRIQNVAAGLISATSTDAINGSQLYATNAKLGNVANTVKENFGGNATLNPDGSITYTNIGNTGKDNIHDAIKAATTKVEEGAGIKVDPTKNADGSTTYTVSAKTDGTTTKIDDKGNIAAVTAPLTTNTDGKVNTPAAPNALATAGDIANAINNSGWKLAADGTTGTELINPSDTVTFKTGSSNLTVQRDGANITYDLAKDININSVKFGNNGPTIKADANNNINIAKSDGSATKITNVAAGTGDNDAVNVSQLKAAKSTVEGDKGVSVTPKTNADGSTTYTVAAKTDNTTVKVDGNGNIAAVTAPLTTNTDGKVDTPAAPNALATAGDIANAINNSGWKATSGATGSGVVNGTTEELINPSETVTFQAGDNMVLNQAGNVFTYSLNKDININSVKFGNNGPTIKADANNNINIAKSDGSATKITNVAAGTGDNDAVNVSQLKAAQAAATTKVEGDKGVSVTPKTNADGSTTYTVAAKTDNTTVKVDGNGNIAAVTAPLTITDGKVNTPTAPNALATAGDIANAINNSGWKLAADGTTGTELINPSDTVTFKTGSSNLTVQRDGANITYDLAKDININSVKFGNNGPTIKADANNNINIAKSDGSATKITNVAAGTGDNDAVNVSQLKAAKSTVEGDKGVSVTPKTNADGSTTYTVAAKTDNTTVKVDGNGNIAAVTAPLTTNTDGKVDTPAAPNALATAGDIANAINNSGWKLAADGTSGTELINPSDTVTFKTGSSNLTVQRDGANITYDLAKDININSVKFGNNGPTIKADANNNINIAKSDGSATKITNVAAGTGDNDAVNVSQLKAAKSTVEGDKGVSVTPKTNADGSTTYTVAAKTDNTTVKVDDKGNIAAVTAPLTTNTDGKVNTPAAPNALATAGDIANAINNSGWKATSGATGSGVVNGTTEELINPSETVTFQAGDNMVLNQAGNVFTYSLNKDININSVKFGNNGPTIKADANNNINIAKSDGSATKITNVAAGTGDNDAVNVSQLKAAQAAATTKVEGDKGVSVTPKTNADGSKTYTVAAKTDNTTVKVDDNGNIAAVTAPLTTNTDGKVNTPAAPNALATAGDIANAINNSGWKLAADGTTGTELINPSDTVTFKTGSSNLTVQRDGANITYDLAKDININSVKFGNNGPTIKADANNNINIAKSDGSATKITNVAAGTGDNDAVNVSQLKAAQAAATTKVEGDKGVSVTPTTNADGSKTYTVAAKTDNTTVKVDDNGNIAAVTAPLTTNTDGKVNTPAAPNALATAGDIANAINNSGWKLAADGTTGTELINPSDTVTFKTGSSNLTVKRDGANITYDLARNINVDSVQFGANGPKITNDGNNIKIGDKDGKATKITNVAAGTDDTDAVNVSQLKAVEATANKGWNLTTNGKADSKSNVKPGDTVDFANTDGNVKIENTGNKVTVNLNKDIDLTKDGSVTIGDTKVNNDGLTIVGGPSVTKSGIDAGDKKITNVADGKITADSQDAVNGGQIHDMMGAGAYDTNGNLSNIGGTGQSNINDAIAAVNKTAVQSKSTVTEGSNIKVVSNSNADGSTNYTVSTADDITLNSVTAKDINAGTVTTDKVVAGNTTVDSSGLSIKNGPSVTASGIDAGSKVVSNVSNGVQNSDAVNMGQLSQYLGGGAGYNNITQSFDAPNYQVNGGSYNNVGDALGALNQADQALGNRITNLGDQLQQAFYSTNRRIDDVEKKANAGIAAAMALENAPYIPGKYTYAAGAAYHGGENAIGLTLRKTADNGRWSLTGGVAAGSSGDPSVRVGISGVID
ncbi:ESPR-type extended signal peptide-containing protein [Acinetobacter sp. CS-2]|uniref:ESPR-type extended signal peptide-containing protein n=1 Tax=Acinetobacter sp. CS-2 TaxID=2798861 RepID=UPI0019085C43|nr:ESPR-type extended signal peptide-containing protein [Acinetobacter sp. CS-2]QQN39516.1 YadA-like family protein [Acinetobacter sp. CS-2]